MRHQSEQDVESMSLGFAITFAAMQHFGPGAGALVAMTSCLSSGLYPTRQPLYQLIFNSCLGVLETWAAGSVFVWLNGGTLQMRPLDTFMAVVVPSGE